MLKQLVRTDIATTKRDIFRQESPKSKFRCQISFGLQLQTFPHRCNTRKLQPKSWRTENKDSFHVTLQLYSPTQLKKEKSIQFHSFLSWLHFSTRSKACTHLKKFHFFLVCPRYKHIFGPSRASNEQLLHWVPLITYKNGHCGKHCRTSKDSWHWKKTWKRTIHFSVVIKEFFHHYLQKKIWNTHSYTKLS